MTNKQITTTGIILIACILVGALAGSIASILTQRSLDAYLEVLSDEQLVLTLSQVKPTPVPGTYEESLSRVAQAQDSVAWFYPAKEKSTDPVSWIFPSDSYGAGAVITSDGWILVHNSVLPSLYSVEDFSVLIAGSWYTPIEIINDIRSDISMIRVEASGLKALSFAESSESKEGEFIFALHNQEGVQVTSLLSKEWFTSDRSQRAEDYKQYWILQDNIEEGSILFDSSGALLGVSGANKETLPIQNLTLFIESVLEGTPTIYPALGVYVISLEQGLNVDFSTLGTSHGYMVDALPGYASAFVSKSPAKIAGLQNADIIVSVGGVDVSSEYPLAKSLERYNVGEDVIVGVMREGSYQEFTVTLGEYNLLY